MAVRAPVTASFSVSFPRLSLPDLANNISLYRSFNDSLKAAVAAAALVGPSAVTILSVTSGSVIANTSVAISTDTILPAAASAGVTPASAADALGAALSAAGVATTFASMVATFGSPTASVVTRATPPPPALPPFEHSWCSPARKKFCLDWVILSASGAAASSAAGGGDATSVAFRMSTTAGGYVALGFGPDYGRMVPADVWTGWMDSNGGQLMHGTFDDYVIPVRAIRKRQSPTCSSFGSS